MLLLRRALSSARERLRAAWDGARVELESALVGVLIAFAVAFVVLVALALAPLALAASAVALARAALVRRALLRRLRGRTVLVYRTRHGWNEVVTNHVLPVLPPGIETAVHVRHHREGTRDAFALVPRGTALPALVFVRADGAEVVSLATELAPLTLPELRRASPLGRAAARAAIERALAR